MGEKLLEVKDLRVSYYTYAGEVQSVRGISFDVEKGETVAIVGESGCGKSVTAKSIMRLIANPGKIKEGSSITLDGRDVLAMSGKELRSYRGDDCAMIFQDALTSLDPTMRVGKQIAEVLTIHGKASKKEAAAKAIELLRQVGIPAARKKDYPHQFSGGMKQRVVIAIALCCEPELLIADEPTTALDVTIQAQVLVMMKNLRDRLKTSMILITHDLGVVAQVCDKVAVMYAGEIIESGTLQDIYEGEKHHPYTVGLFGSIPQLDSETDRLSPIEGLMPDPTALPKGCSFAPRCPHACEACQQEKPGVYEEGTHRIKCILFSGEKDETGKGGAMR